MESISESSRMVLVHQFQDCRLPRSRRRLPPVTEKTCCLPTPLQSQIQVVGFCSEKDIRGTSSSPIPATPTTSLFLPTLCLGVLPLSVCLQASFQPRYVDWAGEVWILHVKPLALLMF